MLALGDEVEARVFLRGARQEEGGLEGLLWEISVRVKARGGRGDEPRAHGSATGALSGGPT